MNDQRRSWPHGLLALALTSVLAACASAPPRTERTTPSPTPIAQTKPARRPTTVQTTAAPVLDAIPAVSPWPRLRAMFAMQGCDYAPAVRRQAINYTKRPRLFEASWKRAMPFLLLVTNEVERRGLPGEFAMLPYVESTYQPVASRGDRAAGMWQLVPDTARENGLIVNPRYDGRLDAISSTTTALDLIERYEREFSDWRLADLAYSSGEGKVRQLLRGRDAHSLSASELSHVAFDPLTHQHLHRLLALACIIDDPARFGVTLPEPQPDDVFASVPLQTGMDLRLAARLAGLDVGDVQRWNAAYRHSHMDPGVVHTLWLPDASIAPFESAAATVPVQQWGDWREQRVASTSTVRTWALQLSVSAELLAAANGINEDATVTRGSTLLVPGRDSASARDDESTNLQSRTVTIRSGDTLSAIAQRYGISLSQLQRLNPRASRLLHPGQRLRLGGIDTGASAGVN